MPLIIRQG